MSDDAVKINRSITLIIQAKSHGGRRQISALHPPKNLPQRVCSLSAKNSIAPLLKNAAGNAPVIINLDN